MQSQTSWTSWVSVVVGSFDIRENYYRCCIESACSRASTGNTSTPLCHLHCGSLLRPTNYFTVLHFRKGKCMHACADRMPEAEGGREGGSAHTVSPPSLSFSLSLESWSSLKVIWGSVVFVAYWSPTLSTWASRGLNPTQCWLQIQAQASPRGPRPQEAVRHVSAVIEDTDARGTRSYYSKCV